MNEDVARIRLFYADDSTVLVGPDGGNDGYLIEGTESDPIGVEFLDTFDNPIVRVLIDDANTIGEVQMEGDVVWTGDTGWVRHIADHPGDES